jgi:chemotaxis family two-component system response regulator Rcp1
MYPRNVRILLVEDTPSDVWLFREALRLAQIPVQLTVARDGVEALHYLRQLAQTLPDLPDLIVLDLNLPRKNGREVLSEINSLPGLDHIPAIVLSSSDADDDREQAYKLHARSFFTKPNSLPAYVEMVQGLEKFWLHHFQLRKTA